MLLLNCGTYDQAIRIIPPLVVNETQINEFLDVLRARGDVAVEHIQTHRETIEWAAIMCPLVVSGVNLLRAAEVGAVSLRQPLIDVQNLLGDRFPREALGVLGGVETHRLAEVVVLEERSIALRVRGGYHTGRGGHCGHLRP